MRLPKVTDWLIPAANARRVWLSSGRNIGFGNGVVIIWCIHLDGVEKPRSQLTDQLELSNKNQNTRNKKLHNILEIQIF